eukprot:CAMPEP_0178446372 /NCGR_PEP_ID=MMETSP0689_2-20121128/40764_1 /TAXON_ID=160604 /ORGANISM="Amphidinium massartii, Strain CS-259" /LENGTH=533 /DNA_ID=CAMNT_0020071183 /DNA_START=146 /DNA_END=1747 /DNA_ORIENTATION=-
MALQGGGFRAQSVDTGFLAGMLAFIGHEEDQARPTLESTGLLDRFRIFSTNSGSSWFMGMLAYSPAFKDLLERIAAHPATAAAQYREGYTIKWLEATNVDPRKFNILGKLSRLVVKSVLGTGDEDSIYLLAFFLVSGFTWNDFVAVLLNSTGAIAPTSPLASAITGSWASGKVWMPVHTAVLPAHNRNGQLYQSKLAFPQVSYSIIGASDVPVYIPAAFSMTLGAGAASAAPYRYVAASAVEKLTGLSYKAVVVPELVEFTATNSNLTSFLSPHAFSSNVGLLPIARVAAASSAFMGAACIEGFLANEVEAIISGDLSPWIAGAPDGGGFEVATELVANLRQFGGVNHAAIDAIANAGVHAVIDGAYTDNTGIAAAVAAGSNEVLVLLNRNASGSLSYLFQGGPPPDNPLEPASLFPVFERPSAAVANEAFAGFHKLVIPGEASFLTGISVGSLQAETAQNTAWGIRRGRQITLNIVAVSSSLNIGEFENLAHYDALTEEVVKAILADENTDFIRRTLLPMFRGRHVPEVIVT